ncbi:MAG TPA: hypothetical protein VNJ12_06485 [Candidatus Dormibacteraeota bacterium]|nr:hypothetical protein [Candidatus Dormibacteraeota bacterium]
MPTKAGADGQDIAKAPLPFLPAVEETAAYTAKVKSLTNYEVWRNVESALLTLMPGQESDEAKWWNLRILLDEVNWRLSGLEGAGSASPRFPLNFYSN